MKKSLTILLFFLFTSAGILAQVKLQGLQCEMLPNPHGIDIPAPRLSWQIVSEERNVIQLGYQILVSSSAQLLAEGDGDIWNSGTINSANTHLVVYAGKKLQSAKPYFWKVISFTNKGEASEK